MLPPRRALERQQSDSRGALLVREISTQDHRRVDGLMAQLDGSLQRLHTDYVDVLQIHEADFRKW